MLSSQDTASISNENLQDLYSYNVEQAKGVHRNNIMTVLMKAKNITVQEAADIIGERTAEMMKRLVELKPQLPSWGVDVDSDVSKFYEALCIAVRGNLEYDFFCFHLPRR